MAALRVNRCADTNAVPEVGPVLGLHYEHWECPTRKYSKIKKLVPGSLSPAPG